MRRFAVLMLMMSQAVACQSSVAPQGEEKGTGKVRARAKAESNAKGKAKATADVAAKAGSKGEATATVGGVGRGKSFAREIRAFWALLTCPPGVQLPAYARGRAAVQAHCKRVRDAIAKHRARYLAKAAPFLAKLRPRGLPARVVYPFGGADLLSALTTYPDAAELTTISLEHAGDPRPALALRGAALDAQLTAAGKHVAGFLAYANSKSTTLMKLQRGPISGQLALFVAALAVHDLEPTDLRFFTLADDGTLRYVDAATVDAQRGQRGKRRSTGWVKPSSAPAFANSELTFKARAGAAAARALRVHRHVAANLADARYRHDGPLARHLRRKGKVAAMTKAASYLLWSDAFSQIRRTLLDQATLIISDSTGVPPRFARAAGFSLTTYGRYSGCFFKKRFVRAHDAAFKALWRGQPRRRLPFRYGYPDRDGHFHLLVAAKR